MRPAPQDRILAAAGSAFGRVRESLRATPRGPAAAAIGPAPARIVDANEKAVASVFAEFSVAASVTGSVRGPAVTTYLVRPGVGVRVETVTKLQKNFALKLGTAHIRLVPVVAGRPGFMGIEVPNARRDPVSLPDLLAGMVQRGPLLVPLGADTAGAPVIVDLAKLPHLLVAGETGAGKSVVLNTIICALLARNKPGRLELLLIDPKRVELTAYEGIPHLVTPIVTDPKKAGGALGWLVNEMEDRYERLAAAGVRNIAEFNRQMPKSERLRYFVAVVDELADLMMVAPKDVEDSVVRLLQLARAAGIHLVLATQRPSVDVVTGLIKANMPGRLALTTASLADSQVILGQPGAEKLIGRGDALLSAPGVGGLIRLQCAAVSDDELTEVVDASTASGPRRTAPPPEVTAAVVEVADDADLELLLQAVELVVTAQFGSTSMLQRKLRIGYQKAGRCMDLMQERGIVGPPDGSKARDVLISVDDLPAALDAIKTS